IQGIDPEFMGVIKPDGEEIYRYHDYAAYIRLVQGNLENSLGVDTDTYPDPVPHCDICMWWKRCNGQRRADDHLTFVAGMGKNQTFELASQNVNKLASLASLPNPVPFVPEKGSISTYNKLRDQAKIQFDSREQGFKPLYEILPIDEGKGFFNIPEPCEHDVFLGSMLNTVGVNKKFHIYTMTNSQDIFAIALGLEEPWHIKEIAFDRNSSRLDIHLGFTKGFKFKAGDGLFYSAHDTVKRSWQHLNFFQHHCYIHAKVPRIKQGDGKTRTVSVPWARPGSGFTLLFEAFAMLLIENEMPVNKAAGILGVYP